MRSVVDRNGGPEVPQELTPDSSHIPGLLGDNNLFKCENPVNCQNKQTPQVSQPTHSCPRVLIGTQERTTPR